MICESSFIQQSSPRPKWSPERSICRASADWNDSILKLSSPPLGCWSIQVFVCWINDWACWKWCAGWNGCHEFHCSEYLRCLLYNPVALPYALPTAFSTPTTSLWAFVLVGSEVQVRSGCWGSIGSSLGVSSGGGAPGTSSIGRSLIDSLLMAIQVHLLSWNHNGSGWFQPAGGWIPLDNSPSFINIGWYCWKWASSQFLLHNLFCR